jgi:SAM-dependent methyltransferase
MREQQLKDQYDYTLYYRLWHDDNEIHASKMAGYYRNLLGTYLPRPQGKSLLDIGCGMGFALRAMREHGFARVRGIDTSPQQIAACKRLGEPGELVSDSLSFLSSCEERFDVVLLLDVLEHVPVAQQIDLMRGVCHVLASGGIAILTVPNANSPLAMRWRYGDYTHYSSFTEHSLTFVLRNAGFDRIEIPGSSPQRRPPVRFWRRAYWPAFRRWFVRFLWRQILISELGPDSLDSICVELNLFCVARKQ